LNKRPDSDGGGAARRAKLSDQQLDVLRVGLRLAAEISGDEVLLFNGETVWLLRRQGELVLNSELWDARRLAIVDVPHQLRIIPTL
jgi:hypothetical protein